MPASGHSIAAICILDEILQREVVHLRRRETVQIDVLQRDGAAAFDATQAVPSASRGAIFLCDRERRARHRIRRDAEAGGETAHEGGLAGTERTLEQHDAPGCSWRARSRPAASVSPSDEVSTTLMRVWRLPTAR